MAIKPLLTLSMVLILTCVMVPLAARATATAVTINDLHDIVTGTALGFDSNSLFLRDGLEAWDMARRVDFRESSAGRRCYCGEHKLSRAV